MLVTAAYLHQEGNQIGFSVENVAGVPKPDLYLRLRPHEQFYVEVKAPKRLRWLPYETVSDADVEVALKTSLERSRHQINRSRKGLLQIYAGSVRPDIATALKAASDKLLMKKGRDRSSVAAIGTMSGGVELEEGRPGEVSMTGTYRLNISLNPHYAGPNPVSTQRTI